MTQYTDSFLEEEEDEMNQFYCNECMGETECDDSCMCNFCVETNGFKHLQVYGYD